MANKCCGRLLVRAVTSRSQKTMRFNFRHCDDKLSCSSPTKAVCPGAVCRLATQRSLFSSETRGVACDAVMSSGPGAWYVRLWQQLAQLPAKMQDDLRSVSLSGMRVPAQKTSMRYSLRSRCSRQQARARHEHQELSIRNAKAQEPSEPQTTPDRDGC